MPSVVKATAIVNGEVITQTDIDQRLALLAIANGGQIPADEIERLRAAGAAQPDRRDAADPGARKAEEIEITPADIDKTVARVAANVKQTPEQMAAYLKSQRLVDPLDPPPDRGRNRLAPPAATQDRKHGQRRRRGSQGGHRQAERVQGRRGIPRRRNLHLGHQRQSKQQVAGQRQQGLRAAAAGRLVRRLCPPIFGSVDRGGRRRPRLGAARAAARAACQRRLRRCGRAWSSQPDHGSGRLFDRRRPGHAQDPDRRSAQCRAQPEAGVRSPSPRARRAQQAEPIVARFAHGRAEYRRLRRRGKDRRRIQRRSRRRPIRSRCATCRRPCRK